MALGSILDLAHLGHVEPLSNKPEANGDVLVKTRSTPPVLAAPTSGAASYEIRRSLSGSA